MTDDELTIERLKRELAELHDECVRLRAELAEYKKGLESYRNRREMERYEREEINADVSVELGVEKFCCAEHAYRRAWIELRTAAQAFVDSFTAYDGTMSSEEEMMADHKALAGVLERGNQ